jgi:tRNA A-37 threonylcarbamoyl transferase component Bud32
MTQNGRTADPQRFKTPSLETVASIVVRETGSSVSQVDPLEHGSVNRSFLVTTETTRLVARINESSELPRFQKEAWAIAHALAAGVPVPEVVAFGTDHELSYIIESYIDGRRGDGVLSAKRTAMWREIGRLLRRIHTVSVAGFGEDFADMTSGGSANWERYLDYNIGALTPADPLLTRGILTTSDQERLRRSFEGLRGLPTNFGLSHGDMSASNVIDGNDKLHVIDWGEANAHFVPHFDLGVILEDSLESSSPELRQLLEGYGLDEAAFRALLPDVIALRTLIRIDKIRWAIDQQPERAQARVADLKRFEERVGAK